MRLPQVVFVALLFTVPASATTLATARDGYFINGRDAYIGQSFTVTGSGSFSNIVFNYYDYFTDDPFALGNGYLFSSLYSGTPSALNSTTPGLLGTATSADGFYTFHPTLTLTAGVQYYFYEDAVIPAFSIVGNSAYPDGLSYFSPGEQTTYNVRTSSNFLITGTQVTPEPSGLALISTGMFGVIGMYRKRFSHSV